MVNIRIKKQVDLLQLTLKKYTFHEVTVSRLAWSYNILTYSVYHPMQASVKLIILIKLAVKLNFRILQVVKPFAFYCLYLLIPDCICQMHNYFNYLLF